MTIIKHVLSRAILAAAVLGTGLANAAPVDLVTNGTFESGLAGWTPSGFVAEGYDYGIDDQGRGGTQAFYGGAVGGLGLLSQTIATIPGVTYVVSLWSASDGFLPNELQVTWNGAPVFDQVDALIHDFEQTAFSVVATSTSTVLALGLRDDSGVIHVDDVSVAAVSEPAGVALFALGLGLLVSMRGRHRNGLAAHASVVISRKI